MEYNEHKPIYLQNVDLMQEKIVSGEWREEERIPSVREMGAIVGVNPNTIVRSYQLLEAQEVIYNKRGMGYYVKSGAVERIKEIVKKELTVPVLLHHLQNAVDLAPRRLEQPGHLFVVRSQETDTTS